MNRARPSASACAAVFLTAPCVHPPPTQPMNEPSARMMAFAPALAEVASSVRTTVASAKGCRSPFIRAMQSMMSSDSTLIGCFRGIAAQLYRSMPCSWQVCQTRQAVCGMGM